MRWIAALLFMAMTLVATSARALEGTPPQWDPMWEIAYFPMSVRVAELEMHVRKHGVTAPMLHDVVDLRLRANNVQVLPDNLDSSMPYLHILVRLVAFLSPQGEEAMVYTVGLEALDPMLVECDVGGYVTASIWSYEIMDFATQDELVEGVRRALSRLTDAFSLEYHRAADHVPHSIEIFARRLADESACQAPNWGSE